MGTQQAWTLMTNADYIVEDDASHSRKKPVSPTTVQGNSWGNAEERDTA